MMLFVVTNTGTKTSLFFLLAMTNTSKNQEEKQSCWATGHGCHGEFK